jgi:hypothetical protein
MENFIQTTYLPNGYLINVLGQVKSPKGKILKPALSNSGYYFLNIKNKGYFIHRAIAFAFIPLVEGKNFVNHKNGIKTDLTISNMEWNTKSENNQHAYDTGLKKYKPLHYKGKFGSEHNRSKKVVCIETGDVFGSMSEAERFYKISQSSVSWAIKYKKPIFGMHFEIKE